ncbi:MAG: 40S ribosomal protein S21, variant 2 [Cercozoa sp. M6MM]
MSKAAKSFTAPRKCSATHRIIGAKDHASVQISIGLLNDNGVYNDEFLTVAFSGFVRRNGMSDAAITKIAQDNGLVKPIFTVSV